MTTPKLRVAMIGLRGIPATYGGVERGVEELSAHLAERGHDITVYARSAYSDASVRAHRGVKVIRLPQINTKHAEAASHTLISIAHAVASNRYDLIHLHATGPGALSPLARFRGTPTVVTVQGLDWRREKWGRGARTALKAAASLSGRGPDRTIVVSRELQRHFLEDLDIDTTYIPNGVSTDPNPGRPPEPDLEPDRFVLYLGRLVPEKHLHTLIGAYRQVDTDMPLVIAGPHSHSQEYVDSLHRLAEGDRRVRLVGPQYDDTKAWLLRNATTFVQPSSIEGLPIALLEALSAGRFPIVSEIPENLEPVTVDGEVLGLTAPVGSEERLAEAITAALASEERQAVGQRLAANVRAHYAWPAIAEATERTYGEAIASRRRGYLQLYRPRRAAIKETA